MGGFEGSTERCELERLLVSLCIIVILLKIAFAWLLCWVYRHQLDVFALCSPVLPKTCCDRSCSTTFLILVEGYTRLAYLFDDTH